MDVFQTAVTSCILIHKFLDGRAKYSTQSKSLAARFRWDSRVLQHIVDYFESRQLDGKLSREDALLLDETMTYLSTLGERLKIAQSKLTSTGWLSKEMNKLMWPLRKDELVELELELFEWTQRLDFRLLVLPEKLRHDIIRITEDEVSEDQISTYAPNLAAQRRMEKFLSKTQSAKRKDWESLWISDHNLRITFNSHSPARFMAGDFSSRNVIIEYKPHPTHIRSDKLGYEILQQEIGELAAALSSLYPKSVGLLKCVGIFHEEDPPSFALVHEIPFQIEENPVSLKALISKKDVEMRRLLPAHPLNERFELARKVAAGVLFLHSIAWVHKAIRSQNILVIERMATSSSPKKRFPYALGNPYLVNFQSSRSNDAETDPSFRGGIRWEEDIYHHPDRQGFRQDSEHARYLMVHDIYSLGVVLLELGIWRPLEKYSAKLRDSAPPSRRDFLVELAEETQVAMGRRYRDLVIWCLKLESDSPVANVRYAAHALETLEELATALL
ncbi:hypothetical protein DIZ76_017206 [Coccidioides immitis]|nr:hypothetical protein DIZ76_017206 [Coccidioides immitis]